MPLNAQDVRVFSSGHVYLAPVGTAFPDFGSTPAAPWVDMGFMTTDGVTLSAGRESTDIFAWQSRDPVRTVVTAEPKTAAFTMMQTSSAQLQLAFGGGTYTEADDVWTFTPPAAGTVDERAMLIEFLDGTKTLWWKFPRVINKEAIEMKAVNDDAFTFPVTMSVLTPASGAPFTTDDNYGDTATVAATGATAGIPGAFTPGGATTPANLAALAGVTASPATAWTTGQYVALGDASHAYWDGDSWNVGEAA